MVDVDVRIAPVGRVRRYQRFSVSLFPQEVAILDKVAAVYGMDRSQAIRFIVNDWQQMKKDQESN